MLSWADCWMHGADLLHIYQRGEEAKLRPISGPNVASFGLHRHLQNAALHVSVQLHVAVYLPRRALTPRKHSNVDVHAGANAFWGSGWPAATITDMG